MGGNERIIFNDCYFMTAFRKLDTVLNGNEKIEDLPIEIFEKRIQKLFKI